MLTLVFRLHSNTRTTQPGHKNRHLHVNLHGVVREISDAQSECSMATRCNTWPRLCYFAKECQGTPLVRCCLQIPIDGIVGIVCVVLPTILHVGLFSWCTLVMNQVIKESWERRDAVMKRKSRMEG